MDISIGLDVGTSGVRAAAVSVVGQVIASEYFQYPPDATHTSGIIVEQDAQLWEEATWSVLRRLSDAIAYITLPLHVVGVSVDATSGTFLLLDAHDRPLTPGILYNDLRAGEFAGMAQDALGNILLPYGISIGPSFALCKMLHLLQHQPSLFERCRRIVHQTDYIIGLLCGRFDVTDISSALKTGADPGRLEWPREIESCLGLPVHLLPRITTCGEIVGSLSHHAATMTGLPQNTPVVSGCTDGTAGALTSGIFRSGDLNVTLGTTLVFKAVCDAPLCDPLGRVYNHRHPAGGYLPGAASSTGAEWVRKEFPDTDLVEIETKAATLLPTHELVYPLCHTGERFPFSKPNAVGFGLQDITDPALRLAAGMEGVAYLERLGIETLEALGLPRTTVTFVTGGGTASELWLRIRAAVTGRTLLLPEHTDCVFGAALLAASPHLGGCRQAQEQMVRLHKTVEPDAILRRHYEDGFARFCDRLRQETYIA